MGLQVEIVESGSVIVVTPTGPDIAALEPLHDALQVAASQGQTVVVDLRELTPATPRTDIIDAMRAERSPHGDTTDADLAAKFADLSDRYAHMIGHCRQLLSNLENPA
jgi:hypothetical protein